MSYNRIQVLRSMDGVLTAEFPREIEGDPIHILETVSNKDNYLIEEKIDRTIITYVIDSGKICFELINTTIKDLRKILNNEPGAYWKDDKRNTRNFAFVK